MAGVLRGGCGGSSTRILYSLAFLFLRVYVFFFSGAFVTLCCLCRATLSSLPSRLVGFIF